MKSFDAFDLRELTGRDTVKADFQLDYRVDPERRTMTLNRLELDLRELARIELSLALEGINPDDRDPAESASLRTASLFSRTARCSARRCRPPRGHSGIDPEKVVKLAEAILDSLRPGQGAATMAVLDALAGYVDDYTHPKGPLRITLNPPGNDAAGRTRRDQGPGGCAQEARTGRVLCRRPSAERRGPRQSGPVDGWRGRSIGRASVSVSRSSCASAG